MPSNIGQLALTRTLTVITPLVSRRSYERHNVGLVLSQGWHHIQGHTIARDQDKFAPVEGHRDPCLVESVKQGCVVTIPVREWERLGR